MAIAKILGIVMLVSLTFSAGLRVNREHLKAMFTHVGFLARALLANIVIVPVIGVIVVTALHLNPFVATGILLMAIAPGVPFILSGARKKGETLSSAIALAFLLPLVSVVTVPITAKFVLPVAAIAELPMGNFIRTLLLFQLLPLLAGIAVTALLRRQIPRLVRVLNIVFLVAVLALLIALAPKIGHAIAAVFGSLGILAAICVVVLSAATGWLLGAPEPDERRALTLASTLRNIGLVSAVTATSFREPEILAAALTYLIIQGITAVSLGVFFTSSAKRAVA